MAATALALAAFALGQAILVRDGEYWPTAVAWLGATVVLTAAGVLLPRRGEPPWGRRVAHVTLAAAVLVQVVQLLVLPPSGRNSWSNDLAAGTSTIPFRVGVGVAGLLILALVAGRARLRRVALPLLLVTHFLLGVWLIRSAPNPHIDVYVFQQEASKALMVGENPYTASFPDIYRGGADGTRAVYGDDLTEGGRVRFGFPYLPLSLFLALPGYLLAGDHRYAQLVAMTLAGALVASVRPGRVAACRWTGDVAPTSRLTAHARPGRLEALAAALLLFTPRGYFVLGRGWTEPFTVLLLAVVIFVARRCPPRAGSSSRSRRPDWGLAVAVGLFLATKQYLVLAVPLVWLLVPRPVSPRRFTGFAGWAALAALLVTLPLASRDPPAFWRSTVTVQVLAPYRTDALSFPNYVLHKRGVLPADGSLPPADVIPPAWPASAAAAAAIALALWRAERSPAGFAGALALVFLPFIALNKQAFANYYHFVLGALCCAVVAGAAGDRTEERLSPR